MEPRVVYSTNELLSATSIDVLPASQKSHVIYQFLCHCDSRYVDRTSQRLQDKIMLRAPKSIRSWLSHWTHLLQNPVCAQRYDESRFFILA